MLTWRRKSGGSTIRLSYSNLLNDAASPKYCCFESCLAVIVKNSPGIMQCRLPKNTTLSMDNCLISAAGLDSVNDQPQEKQTTVNAEQVSSLCIQ